MTEPETDLHTRLQQETGVISWSELARHFARGVVVKVDASLDLIAVAEGFAEDAAGQVQQWMEQGLVLWASDDDARHWTREQTEFTCIVAAPWVLVQARPPATQLH